jgi:broad specificity phosphatase PhoE
MVLRLTLIAAAQASGVAAGTFPQDEAAEAIAVPPRVDRFNRLLAAPERRARETAASFGLVALPEPELADCDFGSWRGRSLEQIVATDPAGAAAWIGDPDAAPHGGESLSALIARVSAWLDRFERRDHTLAVTHPAVIRAAITHVLLAPPAGFWRIDIEPLSLTDLRREAGRWTLRSVGLPAA